MAARTLLVAVVMLVTGAWGGQERAPGGNRGQGSRANAPLPDSTTGPRLDRLERWLLAVDRHVPGNEDAAVVEAGGFSHAQLQSLWVDANVLVQVMRKPRLNTFVVRAARDRYGTEIRYLPAHLRRLRVLGCAASGGLLTDDLCLTIDAETAASPELRVLSKHAAEARARHDANYILRRGALLHTDAALLAPVHAARSDTNAPPNNPQQIRVEISDGQELGVSQSPVHWEIARMLVDQVQPPEMDRPDPSKDEMVRQWYRASAAWMQYVQDHDRFHIEHAQSIFPDDPDLAFLGGCQRETYGGAAIQTAVQAMVLPSGYTMEVGNARSELQAAERMFRRALVLKPDFPEARLRLARVRGLLGRHDEAAEALREWIEPGGEPLLRYFAALFLGAEEAALGGYDTARLAYERAAAIYPTAQSPRLALVELARRRGDRLSALNALKSMFELSPIPAERDDPWWDYHQAQARNVEELLYTLRRPFLVEAVR